MTDGPRDWDKELADIDRIIGAPAASPPAKAGAATPRAVSAKGTVPAPRALPAPPAGRRVVLGTWVRVMLGVAFVGAVTQWPYAAACGLPLILYLGTVGIVVTVGTWGARVSWRHRMGRAHIVALGVVGAGLTLAALAILPRIGYARIAASWVCG